MEEEQTRKKIEETAIEILKSANLEEVTEFNVRVTASGRLGIDLSTNPHHRRLVREVVESYLLSTLNDQETLMNNDSVPPQKQQQEDSGVPNEKAVVDKDGGRFICKLSDRRNVTIQGFGGKPLVSIREYYQKDGKQLPSKTGISLTAEQWSAFRKSVPAIEEAILKTQSRLRSALKDQQNDQASDLASAATVDEIVPVKIDRFDGKNYQSWISQIEVFLKQLKVAYVLADPCPSVAITPKANDEEVARAKAARQKWLNDDYLCCQSILNSLSDSLYHQYTTKTTTNAKELWEELKFVYLYEEFGTKRALVKKYIEFQIFEEKPILDQLQELNSIADSLVATGIYIDENFHVSAVISKLPLSWKDFYIKLMREEYLPFWVLMDRVREEEESRNPDKQGKPSNSAYSHPSKSLGPGMRNMRKPVLQWKRQETQGDNKVLLCHFCGKKGHLSRNCHNKKYQEANGKYEKESLSTLQLQR